MYKNNLTLNDLEWLICHKTKPNDQFVNTLVERITHRHTQTNIHTHRHTYTKTHINTYTHTHISYPFVTYVFLTIYIYIYIVKNGDIEMLIYKSKIPPQV